MDQSEHGQLRAAIDRLCLNDRSVSVSIESRLDFLIVIIVSWLILLVTPVHLYLLHVVRSLIICTCEPKTV